MTIGRNNKAIAFFLVALGGWVYAVIAEHPNHLQVSLTQWGQLLVGVVFATFLGWLTKNADPPVEVPAVIVPVAPAAVDPNPLPPQLPPP